MTDADASTAPIEGSDGGLRRWWWIDFGLPLVVLLVGTAWFWSGERDLALQQPHFTEAGGWRDDEQPWKALYDFGMIPTAVATVGCILVVLMSYRIRRIREWRAPAVFFLLAVAIGPGLIANAVLKDHWNRPRPRAVEEFGGKYAFEPVLRVDPSSRGKSFPCGHASAVFALASIWFLLRERNRSRACGWAVFALVTVFGGVICYARMLQGGHFASDCLWAWGLVSLTTASIYWFLRKKIRKAPLTSASRTFSHAVKRLPIWIRMVVGLLFVGFFTAFLLAVPYRDAFEFPLQDGEDVLPLRVDLELPVGEVEIRPAEKLRWVARASGFGYAGSRLKDRSTDEVQIDDSGEELRRLRIRQRVSGYFSEITQRGRLEVPIGRVRKLGIHLEEGDVTIFLPSDPELEQRSIWQLSGGLGEVVLVLPEGAKPEFEIRALQAAPVGSEGVMRSYRPGIWRVGGTPGLVIENGTEGAVFRIERAGEPNDGTAGEAVGIDGSEGEREVGGE